MDGTERRLLVFNCHEAWVYQLGLLDRPLDIVTDLPGRRHRGWDRHVRPVPPHARLVPLAEAQAGSLRYDGIITHNPTDLLDIRHRSEPKILILHLPLEARVRLEGSRLDPSYARAVLRDYTRLQRVHVVAVSRLKGASWGQTGDIIPFGIDPAQYRPHTGTLAAGLRIANYVSERRDFLRWDLHERAFGDLPVTLVGHNPDRPGVTPTRDWDHLKELLQVHRFYIHTADTTMEDGFNMATVEAMAAGLPVLGNRHPSSPVQSGISGFLSDDPGELKAQARRLLDDPVLALRLGRAAQDRARELFATDRFRQRMEHALSRARAQSETPAPAIRELRPGPRRRPAAVDIR